MSTRQSKFNYILVSLIVIAFIAGCGSLYGQYETKKFTIGFHGNTVSYASVSASSYLYKKFFLQIFFPISKEVKGLQSRLGYTLFDEKYGGVYLFSDLYTINHESSGLKFYPVLGFGVTDRLFLNSILLLILSIFWEDPPFQLNYYIGYVFFTKESFWSRYNGYPIEFGLGLDLRF